MPNVKMHMCDDLAGLHEEGVGIVFENGQWTFHTGEDNSPVERVKFCPYCGEKLEE